MKIVCSTHLDRSINEGTGAGHAVMVRDLNYPADGRCSRCALPASKTAARNLFEVTVLMDLEVTEPVSVQEDRAVLKNKVGEAIGAASTCWEHMEGTGVFQSERAEQIFNELWAEIGKRLA